MIHPEARSLNSAIVDGGRQRARETGFGEVSRSPFLPAIFLESDRLECARLVGNVPSSFAPSHQHIRKKRGPAVLAAAYWTCNASNGPSAYLRAQACPAAWPVP